MSYTSNFKIKTAINMIKSCLFTCMNRYTGAVEDVTSRPTKLIRTELQSSDNQSIQTGDLKLPQLAIYRERRRELPPLPTFRDEVHDAIVHIYVYLIRDNVHRSFQQPSNFHHLFLELLCKTCWNIL
jgi:hypothetical protein